MAIPIEQHPGFGQAMQAYQAAKTAAAESGDPAAASAAELDWANTKIRLQNEVSDAAQAEQARAAAVVQARALVPDVTDEMLADLATPEAIMRMANALKAQRDANGGQQPPADPVPTAPNAQSWGNGPPTGTAPTPQDPDDPRAIAARRKELAQTVETNVGRNPQAAEAFNKDYFDSHIAPMMMRPERYKQLTGHEAKRVEEPSIPSRDSKR